LLIREINVLRLSLPLLLLRIIESLKQFFIYAFGVTIVCMNFKFSNTLVSFFFFFHL
jgi:hypothetical protein